jgi:hypothetical protein
MAEENVWKEIGDNIVQYAPTLGAALAPVTGGVSAIIGTGVAALGKIFGLGSNPDPDALKQAIATDPQSALKLALADSQFQLDQYRAETDRLSLQLKDTESARSRQVEHEKVTGHADINLYVLAWVIVIGFFALTGLLLFFSFQGKELSDGSGTLFMLLGTMATCFGMVIGYFFGSSTGAMQMRSGLMAMVKGGKS